MHELDPSLDAPLTNIPKWPKVVGIVSICWGGFFLLCGGCGLAWYAAMPAVMKMAEEQMKEPTPQVFFPGAAEYSNAFLGTVLSGLLLIAGVMTAKRREAGRTLHIAYGGLGLPLTIISAVMGILKQLELAQWLKENASSPWAQQAKPEVGIFMIVFFSLLGIAYPTFCLVWFALKGKRPEVGAEDAARLI